MRWFAKRLEAQSLQRVSASMPSAKLGIILQTLFIFLINLRFPHPSLLTSLLMGYIRSLQSDAVVRALAVIEVDKSSYFPLYIKR